MTRQVPFGLKRSVAQPKADGTGRAGRGKKETAGEMMEPSQQAGEQGDGRQEVSQEEDRLEEGVLNEAIAWPWPGRLLEHQAAMRRSFLLVSRRVEEDEAEDHDYKLEMADEQPWPGRQSEK